VQGFLYGYPGAAETPDSKPADGNAGDGKVTLISTARSRSSAA
jgi:hypothetical protein